MLQDIKTIDVHAKEWFDRINGNSYVATRTTINYGMPDEITLVSPFEYGYGSYYEQAAINSLQKAGYFPVGIGSISRQCADNNIIYRGSIQTKCLKREVKAFGEN